MRPGDARDLAGQGNGGFVGVGAFLESEHPGAQAVWSGIVPGPLSTERAPWIKSMRR